MVSPALYPALRPRTGARATTARRLPRRILQSLLALVLLGVLTGADAAPADGSGAVAAESRTGRVPDTPYVMPADGAVLRLFLRPAVRWGPGHRGVDVASSDGVVLAPADGTVTWTGHVVDRGVLTITHPDGLRSSFEPVSALLDVGTPVRRGEPVATVERGGTHCRSTCVHWGVRRGTEYLDPMTLVAPRQVRLLPWDG